MKSMTDFIMEQEVSTAPVEVFNESTLVSNFMSMHAAAAEVTCILEFASIAEFCTENDINMPEQLVQEGFRDTINKIWTAIAKWFEKVADWFKSLIKGTVSACSTSNLKQILAKLKTYPEDTEVKNEYIIDNLTMVPVIVEYINTFRKVAINPMADNKEFNDSNTEEQFVAEFMSDIDKYIADLKFINKRSNWQDASGNLAMSRDDLLDNLSCLDDRDKKYIKNLFKVSNSNANNNNTPKTNKTYELLTEIIEDLISMDIPKTGAKILEELDADINGFKALTNQQNTVETEVHTGDSATSVATSLKNNNINVDVKAVFDAMKYAKLISGKGIDFNTKTQNEGKINIKQQIRVWQADKGVKTKVTEASNLLATAYDLIKVTLTESIFKEFKDIKAADEKSYKKELKSVEKKENSRSIDKVITS